MIRGMYTAAAGMMTMLARAQTISNNLANVNTPGFREDTLRQTTFPQQLMARLFAGGNVKGVGPSAMGVVNESTVIRYTQGAFRGTDSPLDMAVQGTGFFSVQTAQGVRYTRDGSFQRDGDGRLVTSRGDLVLDAAGAPLTVPAGLIVVDTRGQIFVNDQPVGQIGVTEFVEPQQLRKAANNLFEDTNNLAKPQPSPASLVHQGYLEGSNVDPARAMADLLAAQRSYESSARMIQLQDDMTAKAANEVGKL